MLGRCFAVMKQLNIFTFFESKDGKWVLYRELNYIQEGEKGKVWCI